MGRSIDAIEAGSRLRLAPQPIGSMSLQSAIPWRVGLHQRPPPLHQPSPTLAENSQNENQNPANRKLSNLQLSHPRGSPHALSRKIAQPTPPEPDTPAVLSHPPRRIDVGLGSQPGWRRNPNSKPAGALKDVQWEEITMYIQLRNPFAMNKYLYIQNRNPSRIKKTGVYTRRGVIVLMS